MDNQAIRRYARPTPEAISTLNHAAKRMHLSARAYMRCLRVARTIADLEACEQVNIEHISEALQLRPAGSLLS